MGGQHVSECNEQRLVFKQIIIFRLSSSVTTQMFNKKVSQVVHTLEIKAMDGLKSFQIQSGLVGH